MTLTEYFALPASPAEGSPAGRLIAQIVADDPNTSFEQARSQAHECLAIAAGRNHYKVLTPRQMEIRREKARNYFNQREAA